MRALKETARAGLPIRVSYGSSNVSRCWPLVAKAAEPHPAFFGSAEAVEAAFGLPSRLPEKSEFVGFWGGFHGKTGGVLGLLGDEFKKDLGPFMPGLALSPFAYCYRCPLKLRYPSCGIACADHLRQVVRLQTQQQVAAIIFEPIQGTSGNIVPPKEFLPAVQSVAKEFGALLISDEMQTGFGRSGKMWGFEHDQLSPDILTVGKGIGGGYPLSGVVSTDERTVARLPIVCPRAVLRVTGAIPSPRRPGWPPFRSSCGKNWSKTPARSVSYC